MRQIRQFITRLERRWSRLAAALAILAVLANQAVLPAVHFATSGLPGASHHGAHHERDGSKPSGTEHQACHFCRLVGAILPPPPAAAIAFEPMAAAIVWPGIGWVSRPDRNFRAAYPARGPPAAA